MSLKVLNQSSDSAKHAYNVACVICHEDKVISGSDDGKVKLSILTIDHFSIK